MQSSAPHTPTAFDMRCVPADTSSLGRLRPTVPRCAAVYRSYGMMLLRLRRCSVHRSGWSRRGGTTIGHPLARFSIFNLADFSARLSWETKFPPRASKRRIAAATRSSICVVETAPEPRGALHECPDVIRPFHGGRRSVDWLETASAGLFRGGRLPVALVFCGR